MAADRLQIQHGVEGRDLVDPDRRHVEQLGDMLHHRLGNPAVVLALREVEQRQHRARLATRRVLGDHGVRLGPVLGREGEGLNAVSGLRPSPVDLPEHDVHAREICHRVRQHVALAHVVEHLEVSEAGRPDLAAVRPVGAVGHEIDPELALRRLHGTVGLSPAGTW